MDNNTRLNILVLGNSGAGKSTLIRAVSGSEVMTGIGEGITDRIGIYESDIWPFVFIDTKGFEYNIFKQLETIRQIKKFTKTQIDRAVRGKENNGIDVVWYCIEGTSRRIFADNIAIMNKILKEWRNVPVFAVITKSYSEADEKDNIEAVKKAFSKEKGINLQKIIPVVAEPYKIDDSMIVGVKGLDELCNATLNCTALASRIKKNTLQEMNIRQKRISANALTAGAAAAAAVVGAVPIDFPDAVILVPLEAGLVKGIFKCYGVKFSADLVTAIVGSTAITNIARAILSKLKLIPNIAASVLNAVVACVIVAVLGEAVIGLSEAIYTGKIDPQKIDEVVDFISLKLKDNPVIGKVISYLLSHARDLSGKNSGDILRSVLKIIGNDKLNKKR